MPLSFHQSLSLHKACVERSQLSSSGRIFEVLRSHPRSDDELVSRQQLAGGFGTRKHAHVRACSYKQGSKEASSTSVLSYMARYEHDPSFSFQQHVDQLCSLLGLSSRAVTSMANKQPALLSMSLSEVSAQFDDVQLSLGLNSTQAGDLVSSYPHLLVMSKGSLSRILDCWEEHLSVSKAALAKLVATQPFILQASLESLEAKFDGLGGALNVNRNQVVMLAASMPELLLHSPDRVTDNIKQLCVIFDLPPTDVLEVAMQYPPLLLRNSELTTHNLLLIANFMQVPVAQAAAFVVKRPEVLGVSWRVLKENFEKVCTYFGDVSRERVIDLVVSNPSLLPLLQDDTLHKHHG